DLTENPGREVLMITAEHAPGGSSAIHRHNAHAFVYVLEGSVVMQLKGGQQVILTPGQTFYEGPDDVHVVDRNASATNPARSTFGPIENGSRRSRHRFGLQRNAQGETDEESKESEEGEESAENGPGSDL